MVGLMQIMIYLFCVYLVYKGCEIFQTAFVSNPHNRQTRIVGMVIGGLSIIGAVIVSVIAVQLTDSMAEQVGKGFQNIGK